MSNIKISQLPNLANLASGTQFAVANNSGSFSVTSDTIKNYVVGAGFTSSGNITANYLFGNGSQLTGIDATSIQNGTSAVSVISSGGNVRANVAGATVQTLSTGGADITGYVTASGNVTGSYILGNGSQLTGIDATSIQNGTSAVSVISSGGNVRANVAGATVQVLSTGGADITGYVTASGNVSGGNLTTAGNVAGSYFIGNGSQLTGIDATAIQNGTANVRTFNNGNVTVSAAGTANVLVVTSTGANIAGTLNATGNISGGNLSGTNIVGTLTTAAQTNITSVGTLGSLSVTGNANVGNLGATNVVSTNLTGTLQTAAQTGITSVGTLGSLSVSGNITGGNLLINTDAVITGNLTVQGNTTTINSNVITTNDLNITVGNNQTTGTALNNAGIDVGSNNLATWRFNNATTSWQSNIAVMPTANGTLTLGGTSNYWGAAYVASLTATGNVATGNVSGTAGTFTNVTGTLQTAAQTNITSVGTLGSLSVTGNITSGNLQGTSIVGTLTTAAQTNITSVGTLTALSVTGNVSGGNLLTSGNIVDTGAMSIITGASGNINLAPNGTNVLVATTTGANVTGTFNVTGDVTFGGNLIDTGALTISTGSSGNITLSPNGTGNVNTGANIMPTANATANIGSATLSFNTIFAKATSAQYADLAEKYTADAEYAPGTVLAFGGTAEVTLSTQASSTRVAGVVSTNPSYIMNAGLTGAHVALVALQGRVPCRVVGPVAKGDLMVAATNGAARADNTARAGTIIGKALENFDGAQGTIEVVVGRN